VITSQGRSHPVEVRHQPPRPLEPLERQVLRALEQHWLGERGPGETVLVFLPGQREILSSLRRIKEQAWADARLLGNRPRCISRCTCGEGLVAPQGTPTIGGQEWVRRSRGKR